ncbi:MAG: serine hydrolase, partial [Gemmatimonadales bacterium]|nr:serine hydrolase [Gemmatimonadales bacterium]
MRFHRLIPVAALVALAPPIALHAQAVDSLAPALSARVAAAVNEVIRSTQVPSASVGIVRDGHIVYINAFGHARLSPPVAARPDMHYA